MHEQSTWNSQMRLLNRSADFSSLSRRVGFQPLIQPGVDLTKLDLPKTDDALDKLANEMVKGGDIERYNAF